MDLTLEDNMVDDLFCATLTSRRGGHAPFVQAGAETSDTGAEAVMQDPHCLAGPFQECGYRCRGLKYGVSWCSPTTPHSIGDPPRAPHLRCR